MSAGDCGKGLLLQAEFDHELDAAQSAALAEHLAGCPMCQERWAALTASREALNGATRHRASPQLLRAVSRIAGAEGPRVRASRRGLWRELVSFSAGAVIAAAIVLTLLPSQPQGIVAALVDDHVRALQPGHLTDVISTDQHTVKPWFDGRLDFSPPVKDLAAAGFPLIGGRLDYLRGHAVAALAYSHGRHFIDLFVWPDSFRIAVPAGGERHGYRFVHWTAQGMSLTAVSDVDAEALRKFARDWQRVH
jgi:anti-sigma factor RsiW